MSIKVMLFGRLSFPNLWTPRAVGDEPDAVKKYDSNLILEPAHPCVALLEAAIKRAAAEKWQSKAGAMLTRLEQEGRVCLHKQPRITQAGEVYEGYEDRYWLGATSKVRPTAIGPQRQPLTEADGLLYSGCYVNMAVDIYAHSHPRGGNRVLAQLRGVQFVKHGDAFGGGRPAAADEFDELAVDEVAEDLV